MTEEQLKPLSKLMQSEVRKMARKGKLVDYTFKAFSRSVYPGAPPDQVHVMRVCFFAGVAEMFALMNVALDPGVNETDEDMSFMDSWVNEVTRFHQHTIDAWHAEKGEHEN